MALGVLARTLGSPAEGHGCARKGAYAMGGINPNEWVLAWQTFGQTTPVAAYASVVLVCALVGTLITQGIVVPIIKALRGKNNET